MKLKIELEIEVLPYTREEMEAEGFEGDDAESDDDVDIDGIGECIAAYLSSDDASEALAGSNIFVRLGQATLIDAEEIDG